MADQEFVKILGYPAADHAVVRHDNRGDSRANQAQRREAPVKLAVGADGGQPGLAPDGDLGEHQRKAKGHRQYNIYQQEYAAAALSGKVREPPDVAKPNR